MQAISSLANTARTSIWGSDSTGTEPPSGQTGSGTATEPYDAGNAPEQDSVPQTSSTTAPSGEEPPSGETGKGTATEPYDTGNAPEQDAIPPSSSTTIDQPSSTATTGSTSKPSTNARMPSFALKETATNSIADPNAAPAPETIESDPNITSVTARAPPSDSDPKDAVAQNTIKKNEEYSPFTAKKDHDEEEDSTHLKPDRGLSADRSLSPGELPDGSHSETGKVEKHRFSEKLKGKLHIGGKH